MYYIGYKAHFLSERDFDATTIASAACAHVRIILPSASPEGSTIAKPKTNVLSRKIDDHGVVQTCWPAVRVAVNGHEVAGGTRFYRLNPVA